jgi:hypothetical protein
MSTKSGFWRKCRTVFRWLRITFRWLRIAVWLVVLAVLAELLWLNHVGLPDLLKTPLVGALRDRGLALEFSRMRLSFVHGLVADNVYAGQPRTANGPSFTARLVQLELDYPALLRRHLALDGLIIRDGYFNLPLPPTNALTLTNLQAELRFGTNNTWSFDRLGASLAGAQISIAGEVAHAPEVRQWKLFGPGGGGPMAESLKDFGDALQKIHFAGKPSLQLKVSGDARDLPSVAVELEAVAESVRTPWFAATNFQAAARLTASANAPTNALPALDFWTNLQPFRLDWSARLGDLRSEKLAASALACDGVWAAPTLTLTNFSAGLGGGKLDANAALDVPSRRLEFRAATSFDPNTIASLLPEKARSRLKEIALSQPPRVKAEGSLRLPPWTNFAALYDPALALRGEIAGTNLVVHGVKLDRLQTRFRYFDLIWELTELAVAQGRTELRLSGQESEATKNFRCRLEGRFDVASARPFLPASQATNGLGLLTLREPLALALDLTGNLRQLETLSVTGRVALTNFAVRGQEIGSVAGALAYTNRVADFFAPELFRAGGSQRMTADLIRLDFNALTISFSNGWSTAEPLAVARAIGPKTGHALEPFQFLTPPLVRVTGTAPLRNVHSPEDAQDANLTFEMMHGVPFRWEKIHSTNAMATIRWWKHLLSVTNITGPLYEGQGNGYCNIDFRPRTHEFDCDFFAEVTNVNLRLLAADLSTGTNRLEGQLSGRVWVTHADSVTWRSWQGHGKATLHEGLLWDVPIFAFMSPVLNTVSPGLGNSRATEAAAHFIITNGVITTDSLRMETATMRLHYTGTVDLMQNVNARVTARLLRNMPVIGSVISTVLWRWAKCLNAASPASWTTRWSRPFTSPNSSPSCCPCRCIPSARWSKSSPPRPRPMRRQRNLKNKKGAGISPAPHISIALTKRLQVGKLAYASGSVAKET